MTQNKDFISTGKAAELCSVTPDTVLKWIKSGRIPANRTPGGHFRIHRQTLKSIIESGALQGFESAENRLFQFCWEYYSTDGKPKEDCYNCIAYRSRAMRCYEVSQLPEEAGHAKVFCDNTCDNCEYFQVVQGQRFNVLVVTRNPELRAGLESNARDLDFNLKIADNEYKCSMIIQNFRADYVILDSTMGIERWRELAEYLNKDPRVPFVKVVLASNENGIPAECERVIFGIIGNPFEAGDIDALMGSARKQLLK